MNYKEYSNKEILEKVKEILKKEEYKEFTLTYVLKVKDECQNCYAVAMNGDRIIGFNPFEKEIDEFNHWDFNIDTEIFNELEWNREIIYMSMKCHYEIWNEISYYYPNVTEYKEGMQKYLKYCKKNKIDRNKVQNVKVGNDIMDIMELMEHKSKNREAR